MGTTPSDDFPVTASERADAAACGPRAAPVADPLFEWLARSVLRGAGRPPVRFVLPGGREVAASRKDPVARLHVRDRRALARLLLDPELCFGDDYTAGRIEVQGDLVRFVEEAFRALEKAGPISMAASRVRGWLLPARRNSRGGSKENIHHHYDLGNEFYRLWLDDRMVYTCAYFPSPDADLEEAQVAKMNHVCRKLRLRPGESVAEAGCGWGALALHMAREHGVSVRAFNVSREQVAWARERARREGLAGRVEFVEDDYRNLTGRYDAFVSVGMLEHVGREHYRDLGRVIHRCLTPTGRGLLHSIGRNRPGRLHRWLERRIFPGAYPPTLREVLSVIEPHGFSVLDVENLRLHYARTLEHWLARFERSATKVRQMFDEAFVRAWRLYLAGSVAAFRTGSLQLFQVTFARPQDNGIPWTRDHLYR
ncbi:MAG: cyclopropane-fatty-acyl-phospholipid synthase family protein [Deferrisomatales bacterium]|nr:cyclopropane-fatty-acyl-phospholipid synthase family protein [Deferrisomatales bacterium]